MAEGLEPGGLTQDFLTRIINVHWESGGGLAVEFGDKDQDAPKPPTATVTLNKKKRR